MGKWSEKWDYIVSREKAKFTYMGNAKYYSLLMFVSMFTVLPWLLRLFWSEIEDSFHPVIFYGLIILTINILSTVLYNVGMYFIYVKKFKFFEQFRVDPSLPWPWEQKQQEWGQFLMQTLITDFWNITFVGTALLCVDAIIRMDLRMKIEDCPDTFTMVWQFFFFLFGQEIFFYIVHRTLHHPKFYFLHKKHHQYKATIALAYVYSSASEHLTNVIAAGFTYTFLSRVYPVHIFTVIIWLTFRMIQSQDGHCGYDWPWALSHWIPFSAGGKYHFFHHSKNVGNYCAITHILDTIFGTNKEFIKYEAKQQQKQQKQSSKTE